MTTFEIIMTVAIIAIVLLLLVIVIQFGVFLNRGDGTVWLGSKLSSINSKAQSIVDEVGQTNARIDGFIPWARHLRMRADNLEKAWACDITLIIELLKRLENCLTQDINWGELTDEQRSEILYRFTHPIIESPFKPPFNPTCDTTSTSIKAEDAPLQERFNDNKED